MNQAGLPKSDDEWNYTVTMAPRGLLPPRFFYSVFKLFTGFIHAAFNV
jgi:hypothetical protein